MPSVSSLQVPPPGRREAGPLYGRQRLGGRHRQEEELHGRGAAQPGRPGETARGGPFTEDGSRSTLGLGYGLRHPECLNIVILSVRLGHREIVPFRSRGE